MDNNWDFDDGCVPPSLLRKEEIRKWPTKFKSIVREAIGDGMDGSFVEEEEMIESEAKVSKLTKEQKADWKQHLLNDHLPYRSDCAVCINAQAYGYQHRRFSRPGPGRTLQAERARHGVR